MQQLHPQLPYMPPVAPKLPKERFLTYVDCNIVRLIICDGQLKRDALERRQRVFWLTHHALGPFEKSMIKSDITPIFARADCPPAV